MSWHHKELRNSSNDTNSSTPENDFFEAFAAGIEQVRRKFEDAEVPILRIQDVVFPVNDPERPDNIVDPPAITTLRDRKIPHRYQTFYISTWELHRDDFRSMTFFWQELDHTTRLQRKINVRPGAQIAIYEIVLRSIDNERMMEKEMEWWTDI